jgi:hypothetical protein
MAYYQGLLIHNYDDMIVCEVYPVFLRALNFEEFNGLEFVALPALKRMKMITRTGRIGPVLRMKTIPRASYLFVVQLCS